MKTAKTIITLGLFASLAVLSACNKSPETPVTETPKPAEATKPALEKTVTAVSNAAATATAATAEIHAAANAQADSIIDQAKALVGQSKYADALTALQKLSDLKLTDSQAALVNSLKEEIKKGLAAKATADPAGAASGLLPK